MVTSHDGFDATKSRSARSLIITLHPKHNSVLFGKSKGVLNRNMAFVRPTLTSKNFLRVPIANRAPEGHSQHEGDNTWHLKNVNTNSIIKML